MTVLERTRDQLLAEVDLADARLSAFEAQISEAAADARDTYRTRHAKIVERCQELRDQTIEWTEVKIGTATAVEDLSNAIDALEADFDAALPRDPSGYRSAVDRQLRTWRSRADWMRVQGVLASMEARDDLDEIGDRLSSARSGALVELQGATDDAKDLVVDLRDNIEDVLVDIRHAVERAADALLHSGKN